MNIDASVFTPDLAPSSDTSTASPPLRETKPTGRAADIERSERNVPLWRSYLPPDCVNTMIKMGWDRST
jgi:hypothetical protein